MYLSICRINDADFSGKALRCEIIVPGFIVRHWNSNLSAICRKCSPPVMEPGYVNERSRMDPTILTVHLSTTFPTAFIFTPMTDPAKQEEAALPFLVERRCVNGPGQLVIKVNTSIRLGCHHLHVHSTRVDLLKRGLGPAEVRHHFFVFELCFSMRHLLRLQSLEAFMESRVASCSFLTHATIGLSSKCIWMWQDSVVFKLSRFSPY